MGKKKDWVLISVSLDRKLNESLDKAAKRLGKTKTQIIEDALTAYLASKLPSELIPVTLELKILWEINEKYPNIFGANSVQELINQLIYKCVANNVFPPEVVKVFEGLLELERKGKEEQSLDLLSP